MTDYDEAVAIAADDAVLISVVGAAALERPARVTILVPQLRGLVPPVFGNTSRLDIGLLGIGVALARGGAVAEAGPMALEDFGRADEAGGLDDVTVGCFTEAMKGPYSMRSH